MGTMTAERVGTRDTSTFSGLVAHLGAAGLLIAAGWYALAVQGVTVASEPVFSSSQTLPETP